MWLVTNQLKMTAPDGKHRLTDVMDAEGIKNARDSLR